MKKTYRWLLPTGIAAAAATPFIAIAATNDSGYSYDFWSGSHRDLVTTTNSANDSYTTGFSFDGARGNLTKKAYGVYSAQGRLFKDAYVGETKSEKVFDDTIGSETFGQYKEPAELPDKYVTFELADQISLSQTTDQDDWEDFDEAKFNTDKLSFYDQLKTAKRMKINVREDMYWVNHKGEKTKYKITARDFVEGFRFNLYSFMGSWSDNLDDGNYSEEFRKITSDQKKDYQTRLSYTRDLDNTYLLTMSGIDYHKFYGLDPNNQPYDDTYLLAHPEASVLTPTADGTDFENTLTYEFEDDEAPHNILVDKIFLSANFTYSPTPVEYIKDMNKNYDVNYNMPQASTLGKMGFFKYGLHFDDMLYSGRYYVSEVTAFKTVITQNTHYWDTTWVNNQETIRSVTQNFRTQDVSLLPFITYEQFKQGYEFKMPVSSVVSKLNVTDQKTIYDEGTFKYSLNANPLTSENDYMWTSQPVITREKGDATFADAYFNSDFALAMYGKSYDQFEVFATEKLKNGVTLEYLGADVNTYYSTSGLAFKSQLQAYINWYAVKEQLSSTGDLWNIFTPSTSTLVDDQKVAEGDQYAIDYLYGTEQTDPNYETSSVYDKHDSNGIGFDYYEYTPANGLVQKGTVTATEQKLGYAKPQSGLIVANVSDDPSDLYGRDKDRIEEAMINTLKETLTESRVYNLEFTIPIRTQLVSAEQRKAYRDLSETIEGINLDLGNGATVKFSVKEIGKTPATSYQPEQTPLNSALTSNYNTGTYIGWSSDVPSLLAWYVGPLATTTQGSASLLQTLSLMIDEKDQLATGAALAKEDEDEKARQELINNFPMTEKLAIKFDAQMYKLSKQLWDEITAALNDEDTDKKYKYFETTAGQSEINAIMDHLNSHYYQEAHDRKTYEITGQNAVDIHFWEWKDKMTSELEAKINGIYSVAASLALFETNDLEKWSTDELLTLERELRNLVGGVFTFASTGFTSPSRNIPTAEAYKSWLTTVTPNIESIYDFASWRVDGEE